MENIKNITDSNLSNSRSFSRFFPSTKRDILKNLRKKEKNYICLSSEFTSYKTMHT